MELINTHEDCRYLQIRREGNKMRLMVTDSQNMVHTYHFSADTVGDYELQDVLVIRCDSYECASLADER